jgi:AcrR family transcriptional regulator
MKDPIQDQLIAVRRNQILEAAAHVFAEKGFHPTTIKDIARHAGIADGTIYNYFENKTALLMGILERMREQAIQQLPPPTADLGDLHNLVRFYLQMALQQQDSALFRIVISEMMVNPELRGQYQQTILEPTLQMAEMLFIERGLPPDEVRLLVRAISGMVMGLLMQHIIGDAVITQYWNDLPARLADLLVNGIGKGAS